MSSLSSGNEDSGTLGVEQLSELFPFHLCFDGQMRIVSFGPSLVKICQDIKPGILLESLFELERPKNQLTFAKITGNVHSLHVLVERKGSIRLRGQMVLLKSGQMIAFLCTPLLVEPGALRVLSLTLEDFPLHDPTPEFIQLLQLQTLAMDDLRRLTDKLSSRGKELRAANESLRASEKNAKRLALIASRTQNAVIITDAEGRVEWANESFEYLTGYSLSEVMGKTPGSMLQGPDSDPVAIEFMRRSIRAAQSFSCEIKNYTKTGAEWWVSIQAEPLLDELGRLNGFMAIQSDVTERKYWESCNKIAYEVTRLLAEAVETGPGLAEVLRAISTSLGYRFAALWTIDNKAKHATAIQCWCTNDLTNSDFDIETRRMQLTMGVGLPGTVWKRDELIWLQDLRKAESFPRLPAALRAELDSGFALPLHVGAQIWGVLEFFGTALKPPFPGLLDTLKNLGGQIEQFVERRQAEEQRSQVLALLDSTLESTIDGLLVTNLEGLPLRYNRRFLDIFYTPENLRASVDIQVLFDWITNQFEDAAGRVSQRNAILQNKESIHADTAVLRNGRILEILSTPHRRGGQVVGRVWSYRDITEQFQNQAERDRLMATLNATLEATQDGILVSNLDGSVAATNQRFFSMWKIPGHLQENGKPDQLRSVILDQLKDPESFAQRVQWLYANPEQSGFEEVHFLDGRVFERQSQPQRLGTAIIGRVWSYRDVTERWRASEALRESEERHRILAETASDGILTTDAEETILFANAAAGQILGCTSESLPGRKLNDFGAFGSLTQWSAVPSEHPGVRADGTQIQLEATVGASIVQTEPRFTVILRDISDRKRAELQLKDAMLAAEAASNAKSEFLANVSHEIRTPLNAVVGLTELLCDTKLDQDQSEMLNTVRTSSVALMHLINDLLDFSKIEAGQIDLEIADFDPVVIGEQAIETVRLRASRKKLDLLFLIDQRCIGANLRLNGDANRLRQVLNNLLTNAIKFTAEGSVTLILGWQTAANASINLTFSVEDSGPGIPVELQEVIFEKFYRIDNPATRGVSGVGLGLSISRKLCEVMGGSLSVKSELGSGAAFSLRIQLSGEVIRDVNLHMPKVLLLAEKHDLSSLRHALESTGARVSAFSSYEAASAAADQANPFDFLAITVNWLRNEVQLKEILRRAMLDSPMRTLIIVRANEPNTPAWNHPGRAEILESPLTPGRIGRKMLKLLQLDEVQTEDPEQVAQNYSVARTSKNILLVDDNWAGQVFAKRALERAGFIVLAASTAGEAVRAAIEHDFDVILMDVMLPDFSGLDATRQIRRAEQQFGKKRTPVIALTAHALARFRQEAMSAGMDDYLTKPVRPQALVDVITHWTQSAASGSIAIPADTADLVPGFLDKLRQGTEHLTRLLEAQDYEPIQVLGHNWKGTGALYGFDFVTQLGAKLEAGALQEDQATMQQLNTDLASWLRDLRWHAAD